MAAISTTTQAVESVVITWAMIKRRVQELNLPPELLYYGVPRGGQPIAALLNPVDRPEEADVIIDDLIDSGTTRDKWQAQYPGKHFVALFDKQKEAEFKGKWLQFPWEQPGVDDIQDHVRRMLQYFDDPNRPGLIDTPRRYVKFMAEFFAPPEFEFTVFDSEGMDEMIIEKKVPFYSLCEHHMAPFFGHAYIGYVPNGKIAGLSKLARTLETFSRRLQNQERITQQVCDSINEHLNPKGVAVVLQARHFCMEMRGVRKPGVETVTSKMTGVFREDLNCRSEFLRLCK